MSHYKPYPKYKDSGVEWLGEVPEHWKVRPVKHLYNARLGKMVQPQQKSDEDILVPYHRAQTVQWERVEYDQVESMWANPAEVVAYSLEEGDLLICEGGDVCRAAVFNQVEHERVIFQNSIHRVRPLDGNQPEWLLRLMQHVRSSGWIDVLCNKNTIVHFTSEKLASLECPHPPPAEQAKILSTLRRETTRIDSLIAKKTRFIELLKEKRSALITHAVTKGLDPNVTMKDSGVEWIGEVPEHWLNMSLKRLAKICNGKDYKEVAEIDGEYPVMGSGGEFARASSYLFNGESVLLGRKGTIDKPLYISGPFWAVDTMFYTEIPKHAFPKFVYYVALNIPFGRYSTNTALPSMTGEVISSHPIAAPNLDEQKAIANYLDSETSRIDTIIAKTQHSIDLLKERRSAIITDAVTGKICLTGEWGGGENV